MPDNGSFMILAEKSDSGKRLDMFIASRVSDCSRSMAADLIRSEKIRVHGVAKKPGYRIRQGDEICGPIPYSKRISFEPEPIEIDILYEDKHIALVNKPPGLVVHPAPGNHTGTLVNALLYHFDGIEGTGENFRPGIVHRLDKDTSGVLVVAKNTAAFNHLALQFKEKTIKKDYLALVYGEMEAHCGTISFPIGRHPVDRKRMSTTSRKKRAAETSWKVRKHFHKATLLDVNLKTGRTHQIRVHCAAINHPIIGDSVYGGRKPGKCFFDGKDPSNFSLNLIKNVSRQMLHAYRLRLRHPVTEKVMTFEAPVPKDMAELIDALTRTNRPGEN